MGYLKNLEQMMGVNWAKSYLWDCKLPEAPAPFNDWFPAYSIDESIFDISDKVIELGVRNLSIPTTLGDREIRLNIYDDNRCTLENFLTTWRDLCFPNGTSVATLSETIKKFYVAKLNNKRVITKEQGYWVRPSGQLFFQGDSNSGVRSYAITLKIVGVIGR